MFVPLATGVFAAAGGLALGSYAVTAGVRAARSEGATRGRSCCDHCRAPLGYAQTVPVFSYLAARGACGACGGRIDPLHLVGEVAGAVVVVGAVFGAQGWRSAAIAAVGLLLIAASATDWKSLRLPDALTGVVAALCLILAALRSTETLVIGLIASLGLMGALLLLREIRARSGRDAGLGLGDVKLVGALSLWLGTAAPWMIVLAALLGLLLARRVRAEVIPFGPAIAASGWLIGLASEGSLWPAIG